MSVLNRVVLASALALAVSTPAYAKIDKGEALNICIAETRTTYGEKAITKLKKIKKRGEYKVQLYVSGVSDSRFTATCVIDTEGKVVSMDPAAKPAS